jgi:predicted ATP-dependent serine protease
MNIPSSSMRTATTSFLSPATFYSTARPGPKVSSGQAWLDDVLAGAYERGTSILIAGTAGAGKSTLACVFTRAAQPEIYM